MLSEKQIYSRLNRCYEFHFESEPTDEWWGDEDINVWIFSRPSDVKEYKLVLDLDSKDISIYEHPIRPDMVNKHTMYYIDEEDWKFVTEYKNGEY